MQIILKDTYPVPISWADSDNDNREEYLFSNDSNDDPDKGGYRDPDYTHGRDNDPDDNDPDDDSDPNHDYTQSIDDEQTKKKNSSKRKTPQVPSGFPLTITT